MQDDEVQAFLTKVSMYEPIEVTFHLGACPSIRSWRRKTPRNNLLTAI